MPVSPVDSTEGTKAQAVEKRVKRLGRYWRALSVKGANVGK